MRRRYGARANRSPHRRGERSCQLHATRGAALARGAKRRDGWRSASPLTSHRFASSFSCAIRHRRTSGTRARRLRLGRRWARRSHGPRVDRGSRRRRSRPVRAKAPICGWLDRPTGLSREPDEPEASLRRAATALLARAAKKADAPLVPAEVRQLTRLYAWLCSDAGSPVVNASSGGIRCAVSRALEDAGAAEVRAELVRGDVLRAMSGVRADGVASGRPRPRSFAPTWKRRWSRRRRCARPSVTRVFHTVPDLDTSGATRLGTAHVLHPPACCSFGRRAGSSRSTSQSGSEGGAQGIPSWPGAVVSPDGTVRWLGLFDPCDGNLAARSIGPVFGAALRRAAAGRATSRHARSARTRVAASSQSVHAGAAAVAHRRGPVDWGAAGLEAWAAGEPVLVASDLAQAQPLSNWLQEPATRARPAHRIRGPWFSAPSSAPWCGTGAGFSAVAARRPGRRVRVRRPSRVHHRRRRAAPSPACATAGSSECSPRSENLGHPAKKP